MGNYLSEYDVRQLALQGDFTDKDMSDSDTDMSNLDVSKCIGVVDAGSDDRGYRFLGFKFQGDWMIKAGCRWFTYNDAVSHWRMRENPDALARVETIMELAAKADAAATGQSEIGFGEL